LQKSAGWAVDREPDANKNGEYWLFDADGDGPAGCWNTTRAPIRRGPGPVTSDGRIHQPRTGRSPEQPRMTTQGAVLDNRFSHEGGDGWPAEKPKDRPLNSIFDGRELGTGRVRLET
jgi:hypothetical protein